MSMVTTSSFANRPVADTSPMFAYHCHKLHSEWVPWCRGSFAIDPFDPSWSWSLKSVESFDSKDIKGHHT